MRNFGRVDLGSVRIHKKVLADIAHSVIANMEGARMDPGNFVSNLGELFGFRPYSGVGVDIDQNGQVTIDVDVLITPGVNIPLMARQIQDSVRAMVESTIDIDLKDVNVNIQGVERRS